MDNKKADNRIITTKQKINNIDNKLDIEKKKLQKLNDIQEEVIALNKSMTRCIDLLSKAIKGKKINAILNEMYESNNLFLKNSTETLSEETTLSKKQINKLYKEKDKLIKDKQKEKE